MCVKTDLLPFVFAFADPFKHSKPGLFCVRNGHRLELGWCIEAGYDFAHRFFAGRTICERFGREWPAQREPPAAYFALTFAQLVFVQWHTSNFDFRLPNVEQENQFVNVIA